MMGRLMQRISQWPIDPVVRRLGALAPLSETELNLLLEMNGRRERHRVGDVLLSEGQTPQRPRFVVSGWAGHQRTLSDGRRQILGFALPGDGVGISPRVQAPALYSVVATTAMQTIDAEPILELVRAGRAPAVAGALDAAARADDVRLLDHLVRLGRQTAYERVAHFMLELQERLAGAGVGDSQRFPLPLTQEVLADTLGLSIVHINRTLQQLRRDKLIELRSGVAVLLQRDLLVSIADYRARRPRMAPRRDNPSERVEPSSPAYQMISTRARSTAADRIATAEGLLSAETE